MPSVNAPILTGAGLDESLDGPMLTAFRELERFGRNTAAAVNKALVLGDTLQVWQAASTPALRLTVPTDVVTATLAGAWVTAFSAGVYRRDSVGRVNLEGSVTGGGAATNMLTGLPAPRVALGFLVNSDLATPAKLVLGTTGTLAHANGGAINVDLAQVSYLPAAPTPWVPSCFPVDLPLSLPSDPVAVFAWAVESNASGDAITAPVNVALSGADFSVVQASGRRLLRLRNVPGLTPSKTFALNVAAFVGV